MGPLPNFVLFFSLACFMFDQTLVEHLYCDKGLLNVVHIGIMLDNILLLLY